MSDTLRTATIRLAYENPDLRPVLLPLLVRTAATPEWAEGKKFKNPDTGNDVVWGSLPAEEQKRLSEKHGESGSEGGGDPKPTKEMSAEAKKEGEGEKAEKKEFRTIALPAAKNKQLSKVLEGWSSNEGDPIYYVSSNAAAGKPLHEREVTKALQNIDTLLNEWKTDEEIPRPSAQDSKQLNTAKKILEEAFGLGKKKKKKTPALRTATIRLAYENPELRGELLPLLTRSAATDPKQAVKSVYKDHERDFKSLRSRIADMKKDSSFSSLKAKRDLDVLIEALDMLKKAGSVEEYADHAQEVEDACGKVLAKSKTDGLDDLLPLVKDVQKGAKAVAAKASE